MALSSWLNSVLMGRQSDAQLSSAQHNSEAILLWELTAQAIFSIVLFSFYTVLYQRESSRYVLTSESVHHLHACWPGAVSLLYLAQATSTTYVNPLDFPFPSKYDGLTPPHASAGYPVPSLAPSHRPSQRLVCHVYGKAMQGPETPE